MQSKLVLLAFQHLCLIVVCTVDPEWYVGSMDGQSGIFPKSYVKNIY